MNTPFSMFSKDPDIEWLVNSATGKGVNVAVIDSGVDRNHSALAGRIIRSAVIRKNSEGRIETTEIPAEDSTDSFGHGTAVAGIIADLAPEATITSVKILNQYNSCTGDILVEGIRWALAQNIKLINLSLTTIQSRWIEPLFRLCEQAYLQDAILVVSRRNFGPPGYPAMFSSVISVERGEFLNKYHTRYKRGNLIECDARGSEIVVAAPGGGYMKQTGTSFATPHVTGIIALMLELWPEMIPIEVKAFLKALAVDVV